MENKRIRNSKHETLHIFLTLFKKLKNKKRGNFKKYINEIHNSLINVRLEDIVKRKQTMPYLKIRNYL